MHHYVADPGAQRTYRAVYRSLPMKDYKGVLILSDMKYVAPSHKSTSLPASHLSLPLAGTRTTPSTATRTSSDVSCSSERFKRSSG